jgi:hypothetical protein
VPNAGEEERIVFAGAWDGVSVIDDICEFDEGKRINRLMSEIKIKHRLRELF